MQIHDKTHLSTRAYMKQSGWQNARLKTCPANPGCDHRLHRNELMDIEVKNQSRQIGTILHPRPDTLWKGGLGFPIALRTDADMGTMIHNKQ